MTGYARLASLCRPTSVAVHDDGDVTRQTIPGDSGEQRLFSCSFLNYTSEVCEHEAMTYH
jgi:hypothetical protein